MLNAYFDVYKDKDFFGDPVAMKTVHGYKDVPSIHKDTLSRGLLWLRRASIP